MSWSLVWVLKEVKSSSVDASKGCISGSLDCACKETVYFERAAHDETPGMSDTWDWVLKEAPRTSSSARVKRLDDACDFGPETPEVWTLGDWRNKMVTGVRNVRTDPYGRSTSFPDHPCPSRCSMKRLQSRKHPSGPMRIRTHSFDKHTVASQACVAWRLPCIYRNCV